MSPTWTVSSPSKPAPSTSATSRAGSNASFPSATPGTTSSPTSPAASPRREHPGRDCSPLRGYRASRSQELLDLLGRGLLLGLAARERGDDGVEGGALISGDGPAGDVRIGAGVEEGLHHFHLAASG